MNFSEIILLMAIALILFGPEDLPDIARTAGKIVYEIRKATADLTSGFQDIAQSPMDTLNKAFQETTTRRVSEERLSEDGKTGENPLLSREDEEELLTYEGQAAVGKAQEAEAVEAEQGADPLAELPPGVVSYEEKGASR
ncbi:MAG: Sec-independent protein translocase subunit TatA/TatB [Desulfitobacteriaceae bacterium]